MKIRCFSLALYIFLSLGIISSNIYAQSFDSRKIVSKIDALSDGVQDTSIKELFEREGLVKKQRDKLYYEGIITFDEDTDLEMLVHKGFIISQLSSNAATIKIPLDKANVLKEVIGIKKITPSRRLFPQMDKARIAGNCLNIENGVDLPQAFTGKVVVFGIIDNGFQYGHPNFYDHESGNLRITRVWDQNIDTLESCSRFKYGCEFLQEADILKQAYDDIYTTHGTHVLGIGAGGEKRNNNKYYGIASNAEIVIVSCGGTESDLLDGIKYIFDYADEVQKPCVINISLGTTLGPHDGTSQSDLIMDELQGPGRLIVGAAGNDGGGTSHTQKTLSFKDKTFNTFMSFQYYGTTQIGMLDLWGDEGCKFKGRIYLYDNTNKEEIATSDYFDFTNNDLMNWDVSVIPEGSTSEIIVNANISTGIYQYNNKPHSSIDVVCRNIDKKRFFIGVSVEGTKGTVHGWIDDYYSAFSNLGYPSYLKGDDRHSICEIGGTGKRIITAGSYNTKNRYTSIGGSDLSYSGVSLDYISSFSSNGPTLDGRIKPDICAPGSVIMSSLSSVYAAFSANNSASSSYFNNRYYYYGPMQGTSMASPFVAGVMATWLEANPTLTPEEAKEYLKKSAINDSYTTTAGETQAGYGKINAYEGLKALLQNSTGINDNLNPAESFIYLMTSSGLNMVFTKPMQHLIIRIYDISGMCTYEERMNNVNTGTEITVPQNKLNRGVQIIEVINGTDKTTKKVTF